MLHTSTSENDLYKSVWHRCRSLSLALCLSSYATLRFFMHHMCGCSKYRSFDWYFPRLESMNRLVHRWSWFYSFFCLCSLQIKSKLPPFTSQRLIRCYCCFPFVFPKPTMEFWLPLPICKLEENTHTSFSALIVFLFAFYFEMWFFDAVCVFMSYALSFYVRCWHSWGHSLYNIQDTSVTFCEHMMEFSSFFVCFFFGSFATTYSCICFQLL